MSSTPAGPRDCRSGHAADPAPGARGERDLDRITVIFGLSDAITDLIANSVGALMAAFVALAIHGRETPNA